MNVFPILESEYAESVRGWSGANPYGMARVELCHHVAQMWADESSDWFGEDGETSTIVKLSADDARFFALCEEIDAAWSFDLAGQAIAEDGPAVLLIDTDDRGWSTWSVQTVDVGEAIYRAAETAYYRRFPTCDDCGETFCADDGEVIGDLQAFCGDCWRCRGEEATAADALRDYGLTIGDRVQWVGDGTHRVTYCIEGWEDNGAALMSYGGVIVRSADPADLVKRSAD